MKGKVSWKVFKFWHELIYDENWLNIYLWACNQISGSDCSEVGEKKVNYSDGDTELEEQKVEDFEIFDYEDQNRYVSLFKLTSLIICIL